MLSTMRGKHDIIHIKTSYYLNLMHRMAVFWLNFPGIICFLLLFSFFSISPSQQSAVADAANVWLVLLPGFVKIVSGYSFKKTLGRWSHEDIYITMSGLKQLKCLKPNCKLFLLHLAWSSEMHWKRLIKLVTVASFCTYLIFTLHWLKLKTNQIVLSI